MSYRSGIKPTLLSSDERLWISSTTRNEQIHRSLLFLRRHAESLSSFSGDSSSTFPLELLRSALSVVLED